MILVALGSYLLCLAAEPAHGAGRPAPIFPPNLPPHHLLRTELRQRFAPPAGGHLYLLSAPQLSLALGVIMNDNVMFFF